MIKVGTLMKMDKLTLHYHNLNYCTVSRGYRYRFRLIGVQTLYPYKVSVEGHKLTVIATNGVQIDTTTNVDYVIVNAGERYDVVSQCRAKELLDLGRNI